MDVTSFFVYCFIVTFTPGPTNIVILSTVHNLGTKKAMEYAWGAILAIGILLAASTILNSMLVFVIPKILSIMQIIGSLYMLYLAYQISKMEAISTATTQTAGFISGALMQFVNPKVVLFTMTVMPSFVMPYYKTPFALALFVAAITVIAFLALITWVLFGTICKEFLQKYHKTVNIILALFLVYSAIVVSGLVELLRG